MRLAGLPRIAAAMAEGRISYAKARELTRVADASNEDYLLNIALHGTASHVEQVVRGYRRALDATELTREAIQQRDQSFACYTDTDGSLVIRGRVPAEIGALFKKALEAAEGLAADSGENVPAGTSFDEMHGRGRKRRVEALAVLAELRELPRDGAAGSRRR